MKYLRYVTSNGIAILVGQSDRSNDELVRHYGSSRHLWLHVRDYPGSHVLLRTNGRDVPQRSLEEAAVIAGYYSQGRARSTSTCRTPGQAAAPAQGRQAGAGAQAE